MRLGSFTRIANHIVRSETKAEIAVGLTLMMLVHQHHGYEWRYL